MSDFLPGLDWGLVIASISSSTFFAEVPGGSYEYRFVLDGNRYLDDPDNPRKRPNGVDGFNSLLEVA